MRSEGHRHGGLRGLSNRAGEILERKICKKFSAHSLPESLSDDDSSGLEACHDGHLKNNDI